MSRVGSNPMRTRTIPSRPGVVVSAIVHLPRLSDTYHEKRMEIVRLCLESMRKHAEEDVDILVWDNSGSFPDKLKKYVKYFKSPENFVCHPRWLLCGLVRTKFVFTIDDDRYILDTNLFKRLIDECAEHCDRYMLCAYGKIFDGYPRKYIGNLYLTDEETEPGYWIGVKGAEKKEGVVDVGSTGISFFNKLVLRKLPVISGISAEEMKYGDDIWVSKYVNIFVTKILQDGIGVIDDKGKGLCHDDKHYEIRNKLCKWWEYKLK